MKAPRAIALGSYGCFVVAVPFWVLAFALQSPEGGGEFMFEIALGALLGCVVLAWVGVVAAVVWRDLVTGLACAVPAALSVLWVIAIFTADWQ